MLQSVDQLPLRAAYKVEIYRSYVLSCIRFDLTVCEISPSRLEALDRAVRKYLRKWIKMIPSAHAGHLFHSDGLDVHLPSHEYALGHTSTLVQPTGDDLPLAEAIQITKENNSMGSEIVLQASEVAESKSHVKQICTAIKDSTLENYSRNAVKESQWNSALAEMDRDITWKACLHGLSPPTYSFAVRSLSDSLPTAANLLVWGKVTSDRCKLCGQSRQTLFHVLNFCPKALSRYSWRHDNVVFQLSNFIKAHLACEDNVLADICLNDEKSGFCFDRPFHVTSIIRVRDRIL